MARILLAGICAVLCCCSVQRKHANPNDVVVAFYNAENLFDTLDDPLTNDADKTPEGRDRWGHKRYSRKISAIASVIAGIGQKSTMQTPVLVGLCEVENGDVLDDLVGELRTRGYRFAYVHEDSPDERGIDVALLYRKSFFQPTYHTRSPVILNKNRDTPDPSRDILVVEGWFQKRKLYVLVNHWPSRSGGQLRSYAHRKYAAWIHKRTTDSLLSIDPDARILSMGDFNDNPDDESLIYLADTARPENRMINLMTGLYMKGLGSLAYRDRWYLFDQILVNPNFIKDGNFTFKGAGIYRPAYLKIASGPYKGYPWRTYTAGRYSGGYSDHFPVYVRISLSQPLSPGDTAQDKQ